MQPLVSVIIPSRNEATDIGRCIECVGQQRYPGDRLEVLIVDGASTDGTVAVAQEALAGLDVSRTALITNPLATTPSNLNCGLAQARGEIVCRVDARSLIPPDYVSVAVDLLESRSDVAVVGGAQVAVPPESGALGEGIARALNNRWAMGLSRYRRGAISGPADTVYLGVFRSGQLRLAGGWDERLMTNQDFDLNRRMSRIGAVWFEAGIDVGYVPRRTIGAVFQQYQRFGRWKVKYWRMSGDLPQPRQLAALAVLPAGAILVALAAADARRRGPVAVVGTLLGSATGVVLETAGSSRPSTGWAGHAAAVAALGAISAGWSLGAWREVFCPRQ